jgi:Protein of unknown function (DUF3810)
MWWRAALIGGAVSVTLVPLPAAAVERFYSNGAYALLQPYVTSLSNYATFALLDPLILVISALWLVLAVRDIVRGPSFLRKVGPIGSRTVVWTAGLYLLFAVIWGLNYRRMPMTDKLGFRNDAVTPEAARAMANAAVDQSNLLYETARAESATFTNASDLPLAAAFSQAMASVGGRATTVVARPKTTLLDWYFKRAAVSGMTDPYFLEALITSDVLTFERPFVLAHEWSHIAGIADEGEANFLAWLTCVRGSAAHKYSGWLSLYQELMPSLSRQDRAAVAARLGPGPRADVEASRQRMLKNVSPRLASVGWRVYDSYLKANRVEAGAASYADVVRLVLGVEFRDNWTPVLR